MPLRQLVKKGPGLLPARYYEKALAFCICDRSFARIRETAAFTERSDLWDFCIKTVGSHTEIDYLEFGVWQGFSMRYFSNGFKNSNSRFYGFDSFEGLPEDWEGKPSGTFSTKGELPDIPDSRVNFVKGWFQDSVPTFFESFQKSSSKKILIHFDADLYSSTLFLLSYFWREFDEYYFIFDEFIGDEARALYNFSQAYPCRIDFLAHDTGTDYPCVAFGHMKTGKQ